MKCILCLSHGNADPERGFSINKHLLQTHGGSTQEETIEAIRLVKDYIIQQNGTNNVIITKEMIRSSDNARSKYEEHLAAEREIREKTEREKLIAAAEIEANSAKAKAAQEQENVQQDIVILSTGIEVAEKSVIEGNQALSECLKSKSLDRKTIQAIQSKIEMGIKRKIELTKEIESLQSKKKKLDK